MMPNASATSPQDTVELALAAGAGRGEVIAIAEERSSVNLRWAGNTLTTNGVTSTRSLKVIAIDRRADGTCGVGVVARSDVRPAQIEDLVREAGKASSAAPPAEDADELPAHVGSISTSSWDDIPAGTEVGALREFTAELGATLDAAKGAGRAMYGFAEHTVTSTFLGTSAGVRLRHDQPTGRLELNAKSPDFARSAWAGVTTRDFSDVDIASLDASLAQRLSWQSRKVELPAGRYETLLPATAVADLMVNLYWSAGAREAAEGRTVFGKPGGGTRVGERLATQPVTLFSDPAHPGLECRPFVVGQASGADSSVFDNGMPAGRASWISSGVLSALPSSRYSATLAGLPVTPAVDNLVLAAPSPDGGVLPSLEQMIASTKRGLLLTCLWYIRKVDLRTLLLTGLTRDGVYLVEDGEVVGAVNNFRFNESPVGMLGRLLEVGATEDRTLPREWSDDFTRCAMPPLRVEAFNMSSVSHAS
ncbi:metallopeptidase TldD-related protein [Streptomyces sp. NBC_01102]|uniref:metallopeptidase TldD-related protein n=1 Tax=Streptomyces sp. NBC_01102 TaxID=2903749 RepID=UPI00386EBBE2|nr:metallopeptidase TldD-related protein [Streptomyces sp. NBC_01102]